MCAGGGSDWSEAEGAGAEGQVIEVLAGRVDVERGRTAPATGRSIVMPAVVQVRVGEGALVGVGWSCERLGREGDGSNAKIWLVAVFKVARNPEADSTLPFVISVPLASGELVLKAEDVWPRTSKVYCHRAEGWPAEAEVLEEVAVRSCVRRGVAVDLVLDRGRENRSQFVITTLRGGREAIFWQSARTTRKTRPGLRVPTRRAAAGVLEIIVDTRERYAWKFSTQQATTVRRALIAGDYAVELEGTVVGVVERKTLADLAARLVDGSLLVLLGELAAMPRAAVVVEDRWADVFRLKHVAPSMVGELLAGARCATRTCRSCSARPASSPRNGPTASSAPPSATPTRKPTSPPRRRCRPEEDPDRLFRLRGQVAPLGDEDHQERGHYDTVPRRLLLSEVLFVFGSLPPGVRCAKEEHSATTASTSCFSTAKSATPIVVAMTTWTTKATAAPSHTWRRLALGRHHQAGEHGLVGSSPMKITGTRLRRWRIHPCQPAVS